MEPDKVFDVRQEEVDDDPVIETYAIPDHSTLKVALEPGYSLQFDDLPCEFQIRIMDRRSNSPPQVRNGEPPPQPAQWMADYGPPRWENESGRVVRPRVRMSPFPSRSREQMQEALSRDLREKAAPVTFKDTICESCGGTTGEMEERIFLRKPSGQYFPATEDEKENPLTASTSLSAPDLIGCRRPYKNFDRKAIVVGDLDIHEMHSDLDLRPQADPISAPKCETLTMPPDKAYDAAKYSSPPESPRSASPGRCSWHRHKSCPVQAGYRCRENTGFESSESARSDEVSNCEADRCSYHRKLCCPATAGIRCRNERSTSPPIDRPSQAARKEALDNGFILNSCKCREAQVRRPRNTPTATATAPPGAKDQPLTSCHCERGP